MPEVNTIQVPAARRTSQDWAAMRQAGIAAIQKYGAKLWTDYNSHDPGITLLEALCYAITDLGYRTEWSVEDILASYQGQKADSRADFFPAKDILPNYPWTPTDFRKLIIDFGPVLWQASGINYPYGTLFPKLVSGHEFQLGIQNVWLLRAIPAEQQLYLPEKSRLTKVQPNLSPVQLLQQDSKLASLKELAEEDNQSIPQLSLKPVKDAEPVFLNGLYEVHLLFEENPELPLDHPLRDINLNYYRGDAVLDPDGNTVRFTLSFPAWHTYAQYWYLGSIISAEETHWELISDNGKWDRFKLWISVNNGSFVLNPELYIHIPDTLKYIHPVDASQRSVEVRLENWNDMVMYLGWYPVVSQGGNPNANLIPGALTKNSPVDFELEMKGPGNKTFQLKMHLLSGDPDIFPNEWADFEVHLRDEMIAYLQLRQDRFINALAHVADQARLTDLVKSYAEKMRAIYRIIEGDPKMPELGLKSYLCHYRNLCEDWVRFVQVPIEEIGLNCQLVITGGFDERDILAQAYHRISRFLSPMVHYRSLEELLENGENTDDIFEGPLLKHGFIDTAELELPKRRQEYVYTSDLLRILMDIEGVEAVNRLYISGYIDGREVVSNESNCIELEKLPVPGMPDQWNGRRRPRLCFEFSDIDLERDQDEVILAEADLEVVLLRYSQLEWLARTQRIPQSYDLQEPVGTDRKISEWQAIQEDLPLHFGVGEEGLPLSSPEERKAQAIQLKGFLLFFDQLLANYVSQLSQAQELFSFHDQALNAVDHSYFAQSLHATAEVQPLLLGAGNTAQDWASFLNNLNNPYLSGLWQATEDESTFLDRRNRFLEHLMARFGESLAEYSLRIFALKKDLPSPWDQTRKDLIEDQKLLLQDLPVIGPQRGKGFCYRKRLNTEQSDIWDTPNVAGLKRRLARLLGIRNFDRRHLVDAVMPPSIGQKLAPVKVVDLNSIFETVSYRGNDRFRISFGPDGQYLFEGSEYWPSDNPELGLEIRDRIVEAAQSRDNFVFDHRSRSKYMTIKLEPGLGELRIKEGDIRDFLDTEYESGLVEEVIILLMELLHIQTPVVREAKYVPLPEEGFHIIEHILFRPKEVQDGNPLLPVRPPFDELRPAGRDPYSFRATVILPLWTGRFQHAGFRKFVEYTIRLEMPAHIWTDIIWVDTTSEELALLRQFEEAYRAWLEQNAHFSSPQIISGVLRTCVKQFIALQDRYIFNPPA